MLAAVQISSEVALGSLPFQIPASSASGASNAFPPALLTKISSFPKASVAPSISASTAWSSVTSVVMANARPPMLIDERPVQFPLATGGAYDGRAGAGQVRAIPSPMPRPAPVTTATSLLRSKSCETFMVFVPDPRRDGYVVLKLNPTVKR